MAIALTELDQDLWFPHPEQALDEPEGLLAMGGDLSQNRLRLAYRHGIFPWYEDDQPLLWWSPPDRAVVFPDRFKPSRSLARLLNQNVFQVTLDERFDAVIAGCQQHRVQQGLGTWITQEMITAYSLLFAAGDAHCIACYSKRLMALPIETSRLRCQQSLLTNAKMWCGVAPRPRVIASEDSAFGSLSG